MQPNGMVPPPMAPMPTAQPQQTPLPQQWMAMMPPYQQQPPQPQPYQPYPPPPHVWTHQPPPAVQGSVQPQQLSQQQQPYGASPPFNNAGSNENRSLWCGDLQYWMDESYLMSCFSQTGELVNAKVIRNKMTGQSEGYGFLEFRTHASAENVLKSLNGTLMPNVEQYFRLNWAGADESPDYTIFVGDLAADVTDYMLQETFKARYQTVKGAKVVMDRNTGRSKSYGFVKFGDESEQLRAMTEMNGVFCSTRPMRIGPAATKKLSNDQQQYQPDSQGNQSENDPNNTTIFVGALDPSITDEILSQLFGQCGELVHVKIPVGKRCGFVQFASRASAEQALSSLNGTQLGGQKIRLSWGRNSSNKQAQGDQNQWNGSYYGYTQGQSYGYAQHPQDQNMYYGGYPGYANYQQPQQ